MEIQVTHKDNGVRAGDTEISEYYDYTLPFYRVFWHGETRALHYGYFDETTNTLKEALARMNEKVVELLQLKQANEVADLGCGVGGTAFWIARHIGAQVHGITISKKQHKKALELSERYGLESKTKFTVADFFDSGLQQEHFDAVYGIESLCYAQHNVEDVSKEIYRITKPGGRVVIADGYLGKENLDEQESHDVKVFCDGFRLSGMCTPQKFIDVLTEQGFTDVKFIDWTDHILPTSNHMWQLASRWNWFIRMYTLFFDRRQMILKNNKTSLIQKKLVHNRTLVYGAIIANKPSV
jgi:cyclopropane fatty-acyl-phospholipid synthase-like methyltransferase